VITVTHLTKRYGAVTALADVSFTIGEPRVDSRNAAASASPRAAGEVLGLIGPNGSGKTTLFECLAGVLPADGGAVMHDGVAVPVSARHSWLFYMPDGIAPWPRQTVRWALSFAAGFFSAAKMPADAVAEPSIQTVEAEPSIQTVEADFDLTSLLDVRIGDLSKGQRKRVLLAMGLLTPQPILLADEPFDGLDLRQTREVGTALRRCAARGRTLFLSIHQIADAARFCDRFVLLSGGRVRGEGTIAEIRAAAEALHHARSETLEDAFLALT
jgi:ABC-2 type transport system ATP-binding protein